MKRIESFCVDHTKLLPGIYVSRRDNSGDVVVTTFDLRMKSPNRESVMDTGTMHTIEHLAATYLRNGSDADKVIYFGPMGCRTGFYLVMFGELAPADIAPRIEETFRFIAEYDGQIPGASPSECGNYADQNLGGARIAALEYLARLKDARFDYPQ